MKNKNLISSIIITDEVLVVNKIKETNKVQHHNDMIRSFSKLDKAPLKILEIAISCIDVNNPPMDNTIYINKQELFEKLEINNTAMYTNFKKYMVELQKMIFNISNEENEELINLTSLSKWSVTIKDQYLKLKFNDEIMPYLLETKEHYTQYQLKETISFKSKYSIIFYKWLIMNYNKGIKYGNKKLINPIISIKEIRSLTNTKEDYKLFKNLEARVIKSSIEEINEKTSKNVTYKKIKKGRNNEKIQFFIEEKKQEKDYLKLEDVIDEDSMNEYEDQQQELKEKEYQDFIKNADNEEIYYKAIKNKKIKEVINVGFIKFDDEKNIVKLYKEVLPIYERIDLIYKGKAKSWLFNHLNYQYEKVRGNIIKDTIVHYLKESAWNIEQDILNGRDFY